MNTTTSVGNLVMKTVQRRMIVTVIISANHQTTSVHHTDRKNSWRVTNLLCKPPLQCEDGKCHWPSGTKPCETIEDCDREKYYCGENETCRMYKKVDEPCWDDKRALCKPPLVCFGVNNTTPGKCSHPAPQTEGASCNTNNECNQPLDMLPIPP